MTSPRPLPYQLQHPLVADGDTPDEAIPSIPIIDIFPFEEPDTRIDITLNLSFNEYLKLASAIDVGRDIAYGTDTNAIWWLWTRALIESGTMTCEQIIECITTDADVQAALKAYLAGEGFNQSPENSSASDIEPIPSAMSDQNMLPDGFDCSSDNADMAIARAIVRELHESIIDVLESIEYATNAAEAANIATDGTPILGTLNNVLELADWFLESLTELYQASYTQAVEDELSCDIYCHLKDDCSLSLNELIDIYEAAGGQVPTDMSSLQAAITELIDLPLAAGIATVATAHCMVLWLLRFGGDVFGIKGWRSLENVIRSAATYTDVSWEDCDCATVTPKLYWRILTDFRNAGPMEWVVFEGNTQFVGGFTYLPFPIISTLRAYYKLTDLGAGYAIKAMGQKSVRRGSTGNGSNDVATAAIWSGVDRTGTGTIFENDNFITCNDNDCMHGRINALNTLMTRSLDFANRVNKFTDSSSEKELRVYMVAVIGEAGAGNTKPPQAQWYGDTLPATEADMFL